MIQIQLQSKLLPWILSVSTGYVSNLTNQPEYYYNSSIAHAFYNGSCSIARDGHHLHGEVVSFGVLVLYAYAKEKKI